MNSHTLLLEGVPLLVPKNITHFPWTTFKDFPTYCGPGDGIGDLIVPDKMYRLKISPACYIHDEDFKVVPPTWDGFHSANSRFLHNLITIVEYRSKNNIIKHLRIYRCATYYMAVDSVLNKVFWKIKQDQQENHGMWADFSPISDMVKELQANLSPVHA